jgi:site-specific DNA recombinase
MLVDGYVRVSQVGGRRGERFISATVQRERIEAWVTLHGAWLGEVFEELDESGGRRDRPLLLRAIRRVETGESRGIVVAKLDRFGRSLIDGLGAIERITAAGGTLVSVEDGFDLGTDTGRLVYRIMLSMAEWELDRVRANWLAARQKAVDRGVYPGRPPTGYRRDRRGKLVGDPVLGPVVTRLFELRAEGMPVGTLADRLTQSGVATVRGHRGWVLSTVRGILRNRIYLGELRYGGCFKPRAHAPLTDPATWARAQRPDERPKEHGHLAPVLLRGMVRCARCRRVMVSTRSQRGDRLYRCRAQSSSGRCPIPQWCRRRPPSPTSRRSSGSSSAPRGSHRRKSAARLWRPRSMPSGLTSRATATTRDSSAPSARSGSSRA